MSSRPHRPTAPTSFARQRRAHRRDGGTRVGDSARFVVALAVAVTALLAGCTDGDEGDADDTTDGAAATEIRLDELSWTTCEHLDEGFVIEHPEGWLLDDTEEPCVAFDPEGADDRPTVELRALEQPLSALDGEHHDDAALVDGRRAIRSDRSEEGPARWFIDLRNGRTLEVAAHGSRLVEPRALDALLDRMVEGVRWVDPRASGEGLEPVGAPVTETVEVRPTTADADPLELTDLRAATHDGFDRVVIELDGDQEPAYSVTPSTEPGELDESGMPIEGVFFLDVRVAPATLIDTDLNRTFEGPTRVRVSGGEVVDEVVLTSTEAGELHAVVGMRREAAFAVAVIPEPTRLVLDVVEDPVAGDAP